MTEKDKIDEKTDNCIFCQIADGKIPSYNVWEDDNFLAFLSIHPIKEGHTLVIPKKHFPNVFGLDDEVLSELTKVSKKVAQKLEHTFNPKSGKIGMIVYGLDIEHAHIHLVPIDQAGDLSFSKAKPASNEDLTKTHQKLISHQ